MHDKTKILIKVRFDKTHNSAYLTDYLKNLELIS